MVKTATEPKPATLDRAFRDRLQPRADALAELTTMTATAARTGEPMDAHRAMELAELAGLEPDAVRSLLERQKQRAALLPLAQKAEELLAASNKRTREIMEANAAVDLEIKRLEASKLDRHRHAERRAYDVARDAGEQLQRLQPEPLVDAERDLLNKMLSSVATEASSIQDELAELSEDGSTRKNKGRIDELNAALSELGEEHDRLTDRIQALNMAPMPGLN